MIINELQKVTSKKEKLRLLEQADQSLLVYAYNPDLIYNVKFKTLDVDMSTLKEFSLSDRLILDKLILKEITGNLSKEVINEHCKTNGDLIKLICNKDLKCGITATSINKVFPKLIPEFKVQLAKEVPLNQLKYPIWGQLKYDGVRLIILFDGNTVTFKTRNGKVIHLPEKQHELQLKLLKPVMLDMEVTLVEGTTEDRTTVSGLINSARCSNKIDESCLAFNVFDGMSLLDFKYQYCDKPYSVRLEQVDELVKYLNISNLTTALTNKNITCVADANKMFETALANRQEGIILKQPSHFYSFKRSKDWVKLKAVNTVELTCININRGDGKYSNAIGALVCEGVVEGKDIKVNVGTGLSDHDRTNVQFGDYFNNPIEVKYNSLIKDSKTGIWSLFLPRFVCIRFDK